MDKDIVEKDFVNISINAKSKAIKIDMDEGNEANEINENGCGNKDEIPSSKAVASKKGANKLICYKCKKNKSNYFNRSEYVCKYIVNNQGIASSKTLIINLDLI
jgi:hypothetical protein